MTDDVLDVLRKLNMTSDVCAGCTQPFSPALGIFLHVTGCPAYEPGLYIPPYAMNRAYRWRSAQRDPRRWTPMRARMFRVYLLRNWPSFARVLWIERKYHKRLLALTRLEAHE